MNLNTQQEKAILSATNRLKKQLFFALLIGVVCTWILFQLDQRTGETLVFKTPYFVKENHYPGFVVHTKGCRIHDLDIYDPSIDTYFFKHQLNCDKEGRDQLVKATPSELYVDKKNIQAYTNGSDEEVKCCFRPFWRYESPKAKKKIRGDRSHPPKFANYCNEFFEPTKITEEFVKVECRLGEDYDNIFYYDYFTFVQKKKGKTQHPNNGSKVSVLVIGLDAVSRLNLYRQLPKTVRFLEEVGAYEMLGYNKVADNTFPNLIPVLTGKTVTELKHSCWEGSSSVFDNCHFVWENYTKEGYQTGYGEDAVDIGLFTYMKEGFNNQPTDYYMHIYSKVSESEIGHEKWLNTKLCLGTRLTNDALFAAIKSFAFNLQDTLSFGFFWGNTISHDYLNLPKFTDLTHFNLLNDMKNSGLLNKTVVVFMSDHGIRWGEFRSTYHGYLEERLPFLIFLVPKWFQQKFPNAMSNLRHNRHRLTTPFDLHETLHDLAHIEQLENDVLKLRMKSAPKRGISLFLPVPEERTCKDAGITYNWCTCHQSTPENVNKTSVVTSVQILINYLNSLLSGFMQCAELSVNRIIKARSESVAMSIKETTAKKQSVTDYTVTIETTPGFALFEATVRYSQMTGNYTVLAPVSRINTYGNQSNCITNYQLKLYCYCLNLW